MDKKPLNLLVVDNDEDWLALLEKFFASEGFAVQTAQKCSEALRKALASRPDCVIVDRHLDCEDGLSLCCAVRAEAGLKGVPIIMLSGGEEPEKACGCSYDAFVCKAQGVVPLLTAVKKLLKK